MTQVLIAVAGLVAGLVGTAGGITSLVSYPALLALGLGPAPADVANIVALVACWPGSALASRPELAGRGRWLGTWSAVAAIGGLAGSVLLAVTPAGAFSDVVPFLVAAGSVALLLQPRVAKFTSRSTPGRPFLLGGVLVVVSLYNGYFGAGAGVMVLALMLIVVDAQLPRANALKNMLIGAATVASAVTLTIWRPAPWGATAPLALGMFCGSLIGPKVARHLPSRVLRVVVALTGIALAVRLELAALGVL